MRSLRLAHRVHSLRRGSGVSLTRDRQSPRHYIDVLVNFPLDPCMLLRQPGDKKALPQPGEHTDEEDLELYALCRLEEQISEEIEIHLLGCEGCRNRLLEIDQFVTAYRRLQELANCTLTPAALRYR